MEHEEKQNGILSGPLVQPLQTWHPPQVHEHKTNLPIAMARRLYLLGFLGLAKVESRIWGGDFKPSAVLLGGFGRKNGSSASFGWFAPLPPSLSPVFRGLCSSPGGSSKWSGREIECHT